MTAPGGDIPEGAYVRDAGQSNSIARLSDISEESAKAMMQGATAPSFNRQRDAAWGVFNDIAYAITGVRVDENGNPIQHIEDWATRDLHNLGEVIADYGSAIEDLGENRVMPWAVPTVAPLSESLNRRADATFQLQGFMSLANPMVGRATVEGSVGDGTRHDHGVGTYAVSTRLATGWNVANRTYLAFITPAVTRLYNGIDFMVGDVSGTPANLDFALFRTDENKQLTSLIGNIRVQPSEVGTGRQVISRTFTPTLVQQGEYIAVAVRQFSTGSVRPLLGVNDVDRPLKNAMFPRKITATRNSTSAIPETINGETELDFEADWFIPYIELSEDVGTDYRVFTENWPDIGVAQRPWVHLTSSGIHSRGGYTSALGNGIRVSMYDTPLATDRVRIRTSMHTMWDNSGNERRSTLVIRGTNNMRHIIGLSAISAGNGYRNYELIERNADVGGNWDQSTVLALVPKTARQGDQIEVDYIDGLVTVRINGTVYLDSLPVNGPQGAAGRFVGLQLERQDRLLLPAYPSPYFGPWSARDLPQANGDDEDGDEGEGPIVGG